MLRRSVFLGGSVRAHTRPWFGRRCLRSAGGDAFKVHFSRFEPTNSDCREAFENPGLAVQPAFKRGDPVPSLEESLVRITFSDSNGHKTTLAGYVGMTLAQVPRLHNVEHKVLVSESSEVDPDPFSVQATENWKEDVFGEGLDTYHTHVLVQPAWIEKMPPIEPDEEDMLEKMEYLGRYERTPESRIASVIVLTKEMDGLEVFVPDQYPIHIP